MISIGYTCQRLSFLMYANSHLKFERASQSETFIKLSNEDYKKTTCSIYKRIQRP
jgi:hypothetical protein